MILELLLTVHISAYAQTASLEETIEELPSKRREVLPSKQEILLPNRVQRHVTSVSEIPSGNLPAYAKRSKNPAEIVSPSKNATGLEYKSSVDLKMGDRFNAMIAGSIVAYPDSSAPVSARILDGKYKGAMALGFASLDKSTKRVNVTFHSIRFDERSTPYDFTGVVTSSDGLLGLEGRYESYYWEYFWAETLANSVSGFANATTQKSQTSWGTFVPDPNPSDAAKQGIANGLSKTAEALAERQRSLPEMTTVTGPTLVQITITK